jgi:hypothetical protein
MTRVVINLHLQLWPSATSDCPFDQNRASAPLCTSPSSGGYQGLHPVVSGQYHVGSRGFNFGRILRNLRKKSDIPEIF